LKNARLNNEIDIILLLKTFMQPRIIKYFPLLALTSSPWKNISQSMY